MTKDGHYIYAIAAIQEEKSFGPIGIGDEDADVFTICHKDIGAVLSPSPIKEYPITRSNTLAHQKVMERIMATYSMLPVRFGTIAEGVEMIREKLLKDRYLEFKDLLGYHRDKVELGLKALWPEMDAVFEEITQHNRDINRLKQRLMSRRGGTQRDQVKLGEMVKKALDNKKRAVESEILQQLKGLWVDHKSNQLFGDQMITNSAFLVKKDQEKSFDQAVDILNDRYDGQMKLKYVGPVPPCNFVEIVVRW